MKRVAIFLFTITLISTQGVTQDIESILLTLKTDRQKADTLYVFAMKQFYKSRFDSAAHFLSKGIPFAEKTGNSAFIANYYLSLGNANILGENPENGLKALVKSSPYLSAASPYELRMKYLVFTAMAFERWHKADSALYYYHQAEALNNQENPYNNWTIYSQLGFMFQRAEDVAEAEKNFAKAYQLTKNKGIRMDYGVVLYRFANLYYEWGKADRFADLIKEQQRFMESAKKDYTRDPSHSMLFVDWQKRPFAEKVTFMENVKNELLKEGSRPEAALANIYLAEFYEQDNKPALSLKFMEENEWLLREEKDVVKRYINAKVYYRLLKKNRKLEESIALADKLFSMKDSILRLQKRETMLELETKYETEKKEKDIQLLNATNALNMITLAQERQQKTGLLRENKLKDSVVNSEKAYNKLLASENQLRKQQLLNEQALKTSISTQNLLRGKQLEEERKLRLLLLSGASLMLLSGATIFALYRNQKRKNLVIQKQSDELQVLMKEIHHRVKNNLQIISSLLDLQSVSIQDKEASEAVKEGKNRVLSMALIHQNLYGEGNIKGIKVREYIQSLATHLFDSYNIQKEKIGLVTDIDPLNLDVDTVIPIGLIINELISNSLKYAFTGKLTGQIKVTLKRNMKDLLLQIKDDGIGFPPDWMKNNTSFGFKLIREFTQKLKAKLDVYNDQGACVTIRISKYNLAA